MAETDVLDSGQYLQATTLLDFGGADIQALIQDRGWRNLDAPRRLAAIYDFVKDEILLGYNADEAVPASHILRDGYGQCNTKAILLMALLRGVGFACRFHAFKIDKRLQKGALPWIVYLLLPAEISHSWVDVWHDGRWIALEGVIVDKEYLAAIRKKFPDHAGKFCGYAIAADDLHETDETWEGRDTCIQRTAITQDLGVFNSPDDYFAEHVSNISGLKGMIWRNYFHGVTQRLTAAIRSGAA